MNRVGQQEMERETGNSVSTETRQHSLAIDVQSEINHKVRQVARARSADRGKHGDDVAWSEY